MRWRRWLRSLRLFQFLRSELGQDVVEYCLLAAALALACIGTLKTYSGQVNTAYASIGAKVAIYVDGGAALPGGGGGNNGGNPGNGNGNNGNGNGSNGNGSNGNGSGGNNGNGNGNNGNGNGSGNGNGKGK